MRIKIPGQATLKDFDPSPVIQDQILFLMVTDNSSWCNGFWGGSSVVIKILLPKRSNLLLNPFPNDKF